MNMKAIIAIVIVCVLSACAPKYSNEDLSKLNAKKITGTITKQSLGSFVLKDEEGKEKTYRTGQLTEYMPTDYRSSREDVVEVTFYEVWERSGKAKLAVLQLRPIAIPEKNKLLDQPIKGQLVSLGKGSSQYEHSILVKIDSSDEAKRFYIDPFDTIAQLNGSKESVTGKNIKYAALKKIIGKDVYIIAKPVPVIRGNGYNYVITEMKGPI